MGEYAATEIGGYQPLFPVGRGPFAEVWKARGPEGQLAALKYFKPVLSAEPLFNGLFGREARGLCILEHANIRAFRGLLQDGGRTAAVLDFLEGMDVAERIRQSQLPVGEVVVILERMLEALAAAQAEHVVHWNVRPANVFLTREGGVKVLDFGQLPAIESSRLPTVGKVEIPVEYMAPERFQREGGPGSDVYAVGLVAWEMLVGRRASPLGSRAEQMFWHVRTGAPDVRTERSDCPEWLTRYILDLVKKDRVLRPKHAAAALALLRQVRPDDWKPQPLPVFREDPDTPGRWRISNTRKLEPAQVSAPLEIVLPSWVQGSMSPAPSPLAPKALPPPPKPRPNKATRPPDPLPAWMTELGGNQAFAAEEIPAPPTRKPGR